MDLGSFLRAKTRHQDFQWDFTFYSALTGLASALSKTHYLLLNQADHDIDFEAIGYHHDIRPPNILVGSDTFILADFGLGRLKQAGDPSHTPYKWISGDYVSPESTDSQENPLTTNRATDVWAFGCLIAEVITYMLKGAEGVEEFRTERLTPGKFPQWKDASFYQPCGDVKKEVINWMRALRGDNSHSDFVPLLVDLALDALQPDPRTRPDMNTIYIRLKVLSMRKHFHSIQEKFCEVRETGEKLVPPDKRHLGSLGYAYERFKAWGNTLTLDKKGSLVYDKDQPEGSIEIMKKLFQALREELETQHSGDGPALLSLEHRIVQSVESLWKFLPNTLLPSAEDQWRKKPDGQPVEERQSSYHTADDVVSAPSIANPIDPLKSEFEEKAQNFKNNLGNITFFHEILKITSIGDVYDITDKIQNEQNEHNGLRNLAKIRRYLERLKGYADVINGIISGSRHILALLWGPIGMLLQLARPLNKAYDSFIDAVAEVGQSLPEFQASTSIFKQNKEAKEILPLFFKDILDFYSEALNFFCHHNWMHIFNRLWPQQYMQHAEIVNRIRRLTRLMRTEIHIGDIQQEDEFRKKAQESFKAQKRENCAQEFHRIMVSFSPERYDTTLDRLLSHRYQATGTWLFMDKTFTQWLNSSQEETRILWLKGIPGAGKTVLSSAIIDQLRNVQGTKTAFAFLTYQEAKTSALSTIHSLIFQLAERNEDLMAIVCESMGRDLRGNINGAGDILSSLIHYAGLVYLVIDGVDEVSETERGRLITELLRLVGICGTLRIILSSRPEADLTRLLDDKAAVIQIHDHNKRSIEDYVIERAQYIFGNRRVPLDKKAKIMKLLEPLASRAEGMFLYARLVMDMVASIHDLSELQKELTVLPENLDAAYHRIIVRLESHNDKRRAEKARMLLGWVACSTAPITVEEAHQALVVIPGNRDQVFEMVSKLDAVELLGPIVETVDNYIRFVHFTAKEYISSPHLGEQLIDTTQATSDLALRCITYLCQHHHDPGLSFEKRYENVTTGQYSLHTFAIRMWFELVCQYFRLIGETDPSTELVESIQMLWEYREIRDLDDTAEDEGDVNNDESGNEAIFKPLKKKHPLLYQLLCRVSRFRNSSFLFTGNISQGMTASFTLSNPLLVEYIG
ncbi:hypothetical protein GL218_04847 [Daldinia childiae]|nr:uncharacterized protein GL218_04847 [Daldinia childiae]KAF3059730.1 hypothetical protein GL218_04847 [Daldinia childiae]